MAERSDGAQLEQGVPFLQDYAGGLEQARRQRKPILVFFSAPNCVYCLEMLDKTFRDEAVVALANEFVCVQVDSSREPQVCQDLAVAGYPTVQFLTPHGVPLSRVTGMKPAEQLAAQMRAALQVTAARMERMDDAVLR